MGNLQNEIDLSEREKKELDRRLALIKSNNATFTTIEDVKIKFQFLKDLIQS